MAKLLTILISFVAGIVLTVAVGLNAMPNMMIKEVPSPLGFDETLTQIEANAKGLGWKVPKKWTVDFQKNMLKVVKVDIGPNKVLKMCEPQAAADILIHDELKRLSTMMPCTIAVYVKSDGKTYISVMNMALLGLLYGDVVKDIAAVLGPQMDEIVNISAASQE
jgi:uncharacterized protein (DUF302 family)